MMAITFSLNQQGALFKVKVVDCTQGTVINKDILQTRRNQI